MSKLYAITNQKGGVGKSTTCANLGTALSELGKKVLILDLDPQAGLTTSLGFKPDSLDITIYQAILDNHFPIQDIITKTKIPNLFLLPSNLDLAGAEVELIGKIGWDRILKDTLSPILSDYDFVFIDCPPSLGLLTTNALMASERAIIPVQSEYLAFRGLKPLTDIVEKVRQKGNPELEIKVLRTMHQKRTIHSQEVVEELEKIFGKEKQIYQTVIKRTIKFAESAVKGVPILIYDKRSEGAIAYRQLAQEILQEQKKNV